MYNNINSQVIKKIKKEYNGTALPSVILVLRNPIERIVANREINNPVQADYLNQEYKVWKDSGHNNGSGNFNSDLNSGLYYESVKEYLQSFNDLKIIFFEDFTSNTQETVNEIISFLGCSPFTLHRRTTDKTTLRSILLGGIFNPIRKKFHSAESKAGFNYQLSSKSSRNPELTTRLREFYNEDINKLSRLLVKDLSCWLSD